MFIVNLEEKLLKENKTYLSKKEQLFVDFVNNTLKEDAKNDTQILRESGFKNLINSAFSADEKSKEYARLRSEFGDKLFTKKQIKSLCLKYNLRFLSNENYKGSIPPELPRIIRKFKEKYQIHYTDFYICAPKSSFQLQEKPKDPLMFHKLKISGIDDLYVLVYKWGNDLSIINRLVGFYKSHRFLFWGLLATLFLLKTPSALMNNQGGLATLYILSTVGLIVTLLIHGSERIFYRKSWNSKFKN